MTQGRRFFTALDSAAQIPRCASPSPPSAQDQTRHEIREVWTVPISPAGEQPYWMSPRPERNCSRRSDARQVVFDRSPRHAGHSHRPTATQNARARRVGRRHAANPEAHRGIAQLLSMLSARLGSTWNCMNQLWCAPESSDRITSFGSTFCADHVFRPDRRGHGRKNSGGRKRPVIPPATWRSRRASPETVTHRRRVSTARAISCAAECLRVGDDAERRRIIATEFQRIDIDLQQFRVRKFQRIALMPARRRTVVETGRCKHEIGGGPPGLRDRRRCDR